MTDFLHSKQRDDVLLTQLHDGQVRLHKMRQALSVEEHARLSAEHEVAIKDRLLAQLAHELRTPLTPAMLSAAALEKDPKLPPDLKPAVEMIRRNTALCAHLLDELMEAVSLTHGQGAMTKAPVDLHEVAAHALEVCAGDAEAKGVALARDLQAQHTRVYGNELKLQQALWNLLKNAVKFTPPGGRVSVRTFNRAGNASDKERVVVEVADTGIGIDAALLPRLVEPFQQGGTHVRQHYGGLGLGLTICHLVAQAHGGTLTARSPGPGQGSVLSIDLAVMEEPERPASDEQAQDAAAAAPQTARAVRSILIVEDHEDTRNALRRILCQEGFEVDVAQTVDSASAAATARQYDVLLCDLDLPDGTGHDLLARLGASRPARAIALSGYDADARHGPRSHGFDVHLLKPVDIAVLNKAME